MTQHVQFSNKEIQIVDATIKQLSYGKLSYFINLPESVHGVLHFRVNDITGIIDKTTDGFNLELDTVSEFYQWTDQPLDVVISILTRMVLSFQQ